MPTAIRCAVNVVVPLLGMAAGTGAAALAIDSCGGTCAGVESVPMAFGRSLLPFWASVAATALVGGCVARRYRTEVMMASTAILGGWGTSVATRLVLEEHVPEWVRATVFLGTAAMGYAVQRIVVRRAARKERVAKGTPRTSSAKGPMVEPQVAP
jgi:hypothetical protein